MKTKTLIRLLGLSISMGTFCAATLAHAQSVVTGMNSVANELNVGAGGNVVMTVWSIGAIGVGNASPQATVDITGDLKIGSTGKGCGPSNEGAMRYNQQLHTPEFCNGTAWQAIGGIPSGVIISYTSD